MREDKCKIDSGCDCYRATISQLTQEINSLKSRVKELERIDISPSERKIGNLSHSDICSFDDMDC